METVYVVCAVAGGSVLVLQTIFLLIGGDTSSADAHGGLDVHDVGLDGHDVGVDAHDVGVDHDVGGAHDAAGGHEVGHADAIQAAYLKVLSVKTLVAFFTFFGLAGLASLNAGLTPVPAFLVALGAGLVALYIVAYLMSLLSRLQCRGNVNIANAVGTVGRVYLHIPGNRSGEGKVTVTIQGRSLEYRALTAGDEIPTGAEVKVIGTVGSSTLEVVLSGKES